MKTYDAQNWFWIVGGDATRVYSSAAGDYVPVAEPAYVAFTSDGTVATLIDNESNLGQVLGRWRAKPPAPPVMLEAYKTVLLVDVGGATLAGLFNHENRIRNQEGAPPLTLEDFNKQMKSLLP